MTGVQTCALPISITSHSMGKGLMRGILMTWCRVPSIPTRGSSVTGAPFGLPQPVLNALINQALLSAVYKRLHLSCMVITHSTEQSKEKLKQQRADMVKILEIGLGRLDAEEDDDCCEIDPAEFAKKVNRKASDDDDVVVVAAKGPVGSFSLSPPPIIFYRSRTCLAG